jgi:hypothetical protein
MQFVPDVASSRDDALYALGLSLATAAAAAGIRARLLGGVGIALLTGRPTAPLRRGLADVDLLVHRRDARRLERLLEAEGLRPDVAFNSLNGDRRQVWWSETPATHVDVFVGRMVLCHDLDLDDALEPGDDLALPFADLLLTKLQVVELTDKDARDLLALFLHDAAFGSGGELTSAERLAHACGSDWGLYTTATDNLARLPSLAAELGLGGEQATRIADRSRLLSARLAAAPKTRRWRARARIGRKMRWYRLPEESLTQDD